MKKLAILVTGMSGAGKTTYASGLGCPVLSFDRVHDYGTKRTDYNAVWTWVLAHLDDPVIALDAWMLDLDPGLEILGNLVEVGCRQVEIHVIYTTPVERYLAQRQKERQGDYTLPRSQKTLRGHALQWNEASRRYADLLVGLEDRGINVKWEFRHEGTYQEYPSPEHLRSTMEADPADSLLAWINATAGDPLYQTIELDGEVIHKGYTDSEESWRRIREWVDWPGKAVVDLGCYLGYFCFKAEEAGAARIVGCDRNAAAIKVADRLVMLRSSKVTLQHVDLLADSWNYGAADVSLLLNSLHHIAPDLDQLVARRFLSKVFASSRQVVFEIEIDVVDRVKAAAEAAGHELAVERNSHRITAKGTRSLLCFAEGKPK